MRRRAVECRRFTSDNLNLMSDSDPKQHRMVGCCRSVPDLLSLGHLSVMTGDRLASLHARMPMSVTDRPFPVPNPKGARGGGEASNSEFRWLPPGISKNAPRHLSRHSRRGRPSHREEVTMPTPPTELQENKTTLPLKLSKNEVFYSYFQAGADVAHAAHPREALPCIDG